MHQVAQLGYFLSAATSLLLLVLLSSAWRGRISGILLWMAVFGQLLWSVSALFWHNSEAAFWQWLYAVLDGGRYIFWLLLLFSLLKPLHDSRSQLSSWLQKKSIWLALPAILVVSKFVPPISVYWQSLTNVSLHFITLFVLSLFCLVLTEQLYRHTRKDHRWALKFLCLGVGLVFLFDFYLYSDALLFSRIRMDIEAARGYLALIYWPMVAIAVARNPRWSIELVISRSLAVRSAVVMFAGVYLLLMALAGYYLNSSGSEWGEAFLLVLVFSAGIVLLLIIVSGSFRSRVKLLVNKHFFASQYDYRKEWLTFSEQLSVASQSDTQFLPEITKAMALIVDSPGAMLWTKQSNDRFIYQAHWCMRHKGDLGDISAVANYLQRAAWVIELTEYRESPEKYDDLVLPDWILRIPRCWAIVPLILGGDLVGIVFLSTPLAGRRIDWEDRDLLKTAGQQLASYVKLYRTTLDLVDARQFEAFHRLSAFVVHDLKNVSAQLSLITTNAKKHQSNPAFVKDAFETVDNAVNKMNRMLDHLRKDRADTAVTTDLVNLNKILTKVLTTRQSQQPEPSFAIPNNDISVRADVDKLSSVLNHLVQNAQEATADDGKVLLTVDFAEEDVLIIIADTGCGMSDEFVQTRLFKPFDTTKGNAGMGIGVYQSREIIDSFGGTLSVKSQLGQGTQFTIRLASK